MKPLLKLLAATAKQARRVAGTKTTRQAARLRHLARVLEVSIHSLPRETD